DPKFGDHYIETGYYHRQKICFYHLLQVYPYFRTIYHPKTFIFKTDIAKQYTISIIQFTK
ncbi:MAG: hypothetical protein ABF670_08150, partial [Liquorilactobacillus ghanensis]